MAFEHEKPKRTPLAAYVCFGTHTHTHTQWEVSHRATKGASQTALKEGSQTHKTVLQVPVVKSVKLVGGIKTLCRENPGQWPPLREEGNSDGGSWGDLGEAGLPRVLVWGG